MSARLDYRDEGEGVVVISTAFHGLRACTGEVSLMSN